MLPWASPDSETDPCCCACPVEAPPSGENWFEITEGEFFDYLNGGTWNLNGSVNQSESTGDGWTSSGSASGSASGHSSGCFHSVSGSFPITITYHDPGEHTSPFTVNMGLDISLQSYYDSGTDTTTYYIVISAYVWVVSSGSGGGTGYPPSGSITVDGNSLTTHGVWSPDWAGNPGYTNSSSGTLTATFTPDS